MRKFVTLITILLASLIFTLTLKGATVTVDQDNLRYTVDDIAMTAEVDGPASSTSITNLVIPDYIVYNGSQIPVTSISSYAFSLYTNLKGSLTIGNSVQTIGNYAFADCYGFTGSLTIGNSVQTIGKQAFAGCWGFTGSLTIGNSVQTIGDNAFYQCKGFTGSLTIPNSVQTIGESAFYYCSGFTDSLTIGNSVQTIGDNAFEGCSGFTGSLTIGNSVQTIGDNAFLACSGFTGSLTIPNSVQKIGEWAFNKCSGFTGSLTIGNSVQTIGDNAFSDCPGFTGSLTIPNSVQTIGDLAFSDCSGFTSLTIGESVKTIGNENYGMAFSFCSGLEYITCLSKIPPAVYRKNFSSYIYQRPLYVPEESIDAYKTAFDWKDFQYINPIKIEATEITLNKTEISLLVGQEETLIATLTPEDASTEIVWSIENGGESIVSLTQEGKVTALSVGTATVTATAGNVSASCEVKVSPVPPSSVTLNVSDLKLLIGQSYTLQADINPSNTTDQSLTWSSEENEIASVTPEGVVTAVSAGTSIITVKCGEVSTTCQVTVYSSDDVSVSPGSATTTGSSGTSPAENTDEGASLIGNDLTLRVGQTGVIELELPQDLTEIPQFTWYIEATRPTVASMVNNSNTSASFLGESMGSVSYEVSLNSKTLVRGTITVIAENPMTSLRLNPEEISVAQNADPFQIKAEFTPDNADASLLNWTSSQPSVATVANDGTVTILAQGETTITATATDGSQLSATSQVTVTKPIDENFDFDFSDAVMDDMEGITIYLGDTYQFKPKAQEGYVLPENISWSSDAAQTVSVQSDGTVTGLALGSATITASATVNGKTVTATCKVKVIPILASTVTVTPAKASIMAGGATTLSASLTPDNVTDQAITWNSQNPEVATVGTNGEVQGISKGTAIITANCGEVSGQCEITVYDSTDVEVLPGDGTSNGEDGNSPAENTDGHGSLTGNDLTLRVNQTASIKLQLPSGLTNEPTLEWSIAADGTGIASIIKTSDLEAQFKGLAMGETTYSVKVAGTTEEVASGKVTVIAENPMTSLRLNPEEISVAQNADPFQIKAEFTPDNADASLLNWTSSQPSVATVANDGTVTILAQGETTITATATDGSQLSATSQVTVTKPIDENFDFDFSDAVMDDMEGITIYLGDTYQFKPKAQEGYVLPENISWSSDAAQTVSVTPEGLVKGEALGSATITASATVNGKTVTATCKVKVIPILASTVTVTPAKASIMAGGTTTLSASLTPDNVTDQAITWNSQNPEVATVGTNGEVKGISKGTAIITATCGEVSGQCEITVYDSTDVDVLPGDGTSNGEDGNSPAQNTNGHGSLTGDDLTLRVNQTASIKLQLPSGLTTVPTLEWSIAADGTGIASIIKTSDLEAQFKGLAMGETTYSVKVAGTTEEVASGKVTVIAENPMTSLRLNPEEISVAQNADPFQIKAEYTPENADVSLLNWTSSQPSVATVANDGTVTILAQGQTTITATTTDGSELSAECQVTVTKPIDENFDFDFSDAVMDDMEGITIYLGETYQFKPKAQDGYVLPENISWSSDAAQTVSVQSDGTVTGLALGSATITASATVNGKTVTATCKVKVIPILASTVTVTPAKASIMAGGTTTLSASITPDNVTVQAITWNSQNPEVATVGTNGEVKGISKGTAIITATCGEVSGQCEITVYDSTDVEVLPGDGTSNGEDGNSPAENTDGHGSLTGNDLTLRVNQTASIKLQLPSGLTTVPTLEWSVVTDGTAVASVMKTSDLEAQFKGLAMGETTYSVKVAGTTEEVASGKVTVIAENPMTSLSLNPEEISVAQNADPFQIKAEYTPDNADVSLLNWTSSQPSVATVANDGTVTILAQGQTTITATATDGSELSATSQVTVTKPIDENFDFDFSDAVMDDMEGITIYLGETYQFKPKAQEGYVLPENISWSSDAAQTVSVQSDGTVTGLALGSATITASAMVNGKEVTATCVVKVIPIPASTIEIDGQGVKILKTTGTLQLKATVMPENTTLADVTWQSSDPAVAQVSDQGLVTALTPGEVTITAFVTNQPTVKDEYKIQVQERLLGDANDNGVVNVADVGTISDYIVKKPVANFSFVNADVVPDNQITTADVTATIEIIFNDTPTVMAMTRSASNHPMTGDRLAVDDFNTNGKESTEIGIRLENSIDYVGIQGSIQIPEGMTVERIERGPGAARHILNYNITDDGNLIFILYSLDNLPLARGNDCLVNLFVKADESCEGIEIEDILASDINARQYTLTSTGGTNHGFTSWLEEIGDRQIRIYSQVGCITVSNARGERVEIYTFDGKTMVGSTATSDKETYRLAPGIYIVRVRDINVKLVVK